MSERFPQPLCSPWPKALPPLAGQHSRSANNSSVLPLSAYRSLLPSATPHALWISEVSSHCHQGEQILPLASFQHDHIFLFCSLHRTCHYISIRLFPCLLSSTSPRRAENFLAYSLWDPQHLEKRLTTLHPPPRRLSPTPSSAGPGAPSLGQALCKGLRFLFPAESPKEPRLGLLCSLLQARDVRLKGRKLLVQGCPASREGHGNSDPLPSAFQVHSEYALGNDA